MATSDDRMKPGAKIEKGFLGLGGKKVKGIPADARLCTQEEVQQLLPMLQGDYDIVSAKTVLAEGTIVGGGIHEETFKFAKIVDNKLFLSGGANMRNDAVLGLRNHLETRELKFWRSPDGQTTYIDRTGAVLVKADAQEIQLVTGLGSRMHFRRRAQSVPVPLQKVNAPYVGGSLFGPVVDDTDWHNAGRIDGLSYRPTVLVVAEGSQTSPVPLVVDPYAVTMPSLINMACNACHVPYDQSIHLREAKTGVLVQHPQQLRSHELYVVGGAPPAQVPPAYFPPQQAYHQGPPPPQNAQPPPQGAYPPQQAAPSQPSGPPPYQ